MSLVVNNISFEQAVRAIRELILDTNPVQCLRVSFEQGFSFSMTKDSVTVKYMVLPLATSAFYDLVEALVYNSATLTILPDYIANSELSELVAFSTGQNTDVTLKRRRYFSQKQIEEVMVDHFASYFPFYGMERTVEELFSQLNYLEQRRLILWCAYYLVDRKRMLTTTAVEIRKLSSGEAGSEFVNTSRTVTTKVDDVFSVTETESAPTKASGGFTALWGDSYSYLTKLQLWIRDRFERTFRDYSLRDDAIISTTFILEKAWQPAAYTDTINFYGDDKDYFLNDRE